MKFKPTHLKSGKAFSLIELSIVVLIIGILVAGVLSGQKLLRKVKLSSARALTQSSPVAGIKDLVLWLDTTSEKSFDPSVDESTSISKWYDINPQSLSKINAVPVTSSNFSNLSNITSPLYETDPSIGLPMLKFRGTYNTNKVDCLSLPDGSLPSGDSSYTFIAAIRPLSSYSTVRAIINVGERSGAGAAPSYLSLTSNQVLMNNYNSSNAGSGGKPTLPAANQTAIIAGTYGNGYSYSESVTASTYSYANGVGKYSSSNTSGNFASSDFNLIGCGHYLNTGASAYIYWGYIGEIIVFSRELKKEERQAIEKYLGQKWQVQIQQS